MEEVKQKRKNVIIISVVIVLIISIVLMITFKIIKKNEQDKYNNQVRELVNSCIGGENTEIIGNYTCKKSSGERGEWGETYYSITFKEDYLCELYYEFEYPIMNIEETVVEDAFFYKVVGEEFDSAFERNETYIELYEVDFETMTSNLVYELTYYKTERDDYIYHNVYQSKNYNQLIDFSPNTLTRKTKIENN